jgi:hypothetical protein
VWELEDLRLGGYEGEKAIRRFIEDRWGTFEDYEIEAEEVVALPHGVVFVRVREEGRLKGSKARVDQQRGWVLLWQNGKGGWALSISTATTLAPPLALASASPTRETDVISAAGLCISDDERRERRVNVYLSVLGQTRDRDSRDRPPDTDNALEVDAVSAVARQLFRDVPTRLDGYVQRVTDPV